ncbi:hypothetical protein NDU88_006457 [Pleurodeles waltl]|uniref:Uncharacterized protein n=1 Tax=Pleurodeles waltl TaxID=8319 RepID=A0AAV7VPV2_PLEWA|nr:hypothetical protein NDU88_006457 [Pleurodeles waltl]
MQRPQDVGTPEESERRPPEPRRFNICAEADGPIHPLTGLRSSQTGWEGHPRSQASRHSGKVSRKKNGGHQQQEEASSLSALTGPCPRGSQRPYQPPAGPRGGRRRQHRPRSQEA